MADPICRWRNATPEVVCEFVNALPKNKMSKEEFRSHMSISWSGDFIRTPYQLACQLGLYYESPDNIYYPRFNKNITLEEASKYLEHWMHRYYVPNPYTREFNNMDHPVTILSNFVEYIEHQDHPALYDSAILEIFKETIKNKDILKNALNNYSKVIQINSDGYMTLLPDYKEKLNMHLDRNDKKQFFENFNLEDYANKNLQIIFYGAPGTGKSTRVKGITSSKSKTVITFHPDTDYSSFVGIYKPALNGTDITYKFVPQAFAKAYVKAWKDLTEDHYLVIEEINRGNCAQIFGDIFQLLDRDLTGYSDYVIDIDKDFADYLKTELGGNEVYIEKMRELCYDFDEESFTQIALPYNLHILATMNTSDQSLFPMDSAFKRRWDWEYIPIDLGDAVQINITIGDKRYNWGNFLKKINPKIKELTGSEDKQLGNRFVKVVDNNMTMEQFRSKVLFYLWFEIFRDYTDTLKTIFRMKRADKDKEFSFTELFGEDSVSMIQNFMAYNEIDIVE